MNELLKGTFQTKTQVTDAPAKPESLEDRFEREAMKRLGGRIAYVSKKKVMWDLKNDKG